MENPALPGNSSTVTVHGVKLDGWSFDDARGRLRDGAGRLPGAVDRRRGRRGVAHDGRRRRLCSGRARRTSSACQRRPAARRRARRTSHAVPGDALDAGDERRVAGEVVLRPLVLADVQRIHRAAQDERADQRADGAAGARRADDDVDQVNRMHCRARRVPARRGQPHQRPDARRRRARRGRPRAAGPRLLRAGARVRLDPGRVRRR